jgi:hypothetical protein
MYSSLKTAFFAVGCLMTISGVLQLSLISAREVSCLFSRFFHMHSHVTRKDRSLSFLSKDLLSQAPSALPNEASRRISACTDLSDATDAFDPLDDSFDGFEETKIKKE